MSSLIQTLFGGSNSNANTQSTSTQTNYTNPALSSLANPLSSSLSNLLSSWGSSGPSYNQSTNNITPTLASGATNLLNSSTLTQPGAASNNWIDSVLQGNYMPGGSAANPFTTAAIQAGQTATNEGLATTLGNTLPGRFTANGQFIQPNTNGNGGSSAFDTAAALATQSAANADAGIAANIENTAYGNAQTQQTQAAGLDQNAVNTAVNALNAQALPTTIAQQGIQNGLTSYQTNLQSLLTLLQTIGQVQAPILAANSQSTGESTSTSSKGVIPDLFPKGIGGGSSS